MSSVRQERQPAERGVAEVAPGVLRLQLPLNMPGLGHVNCYAIEDREGVALVDPGMPSSRSWRVLKSKLAEAGLPLERVHTVLVSHSHPDHYGAAQRIRELTGADVITHEHFKTYWDPHEEDDFVREVRGGGGLRRADGRHRARTAEDDGRRTPLPMGPTGALGWAATRRPVERAPEVAHPAADAGEDLAAAEAIASGDRW